jgi:energy-converting hydrogenase Eha subunit E
MTIIIIVLGVAAVVLGGVFIGMGFAKEDMLVTAMQQEQITLGIPEAELAAGELIDTAEEAEVAGDTIREHRHGIAPTYGDLLGEGRYDPTNPQQLSYAQALNLENYLYLAVLGFGVTQVVMGTGAFMVITGLALVGTGIVLRGQR